MREATIDSMISIVGRMGGSGSTKSRRSGSV